MHVGLKLITTGAMLDNVHSENQSSAWDASLGEK